MQARRLFWDEVIEGPIAQEVLEGNDAKADVLLSEALTERQAASRAAFYLIGAGPGHPDLMTVRGAQLLGLADVILYDRLVPPDALTRYARKEALKIPVGKSAGDHSRTQDEIGELIAQHLCANKIVVRLKGGDPGIYAHATEELEIARQLDVPYQIVPGITAAAGCAAAAGIPLTERDGANSVRFLTAYERNLHDERFWQSLALSPKDTLVFYMTTRQSSFLCRKLLEEGFSPLTPMVVIEQGTTPCHAEYEATLGTFTERYGDRTFITPALLIIGDVVRWRARFSWKEPPKERRSWFDAQLEDIHHAGE
jgi:uroporphyrin-III C-methyltransferase/precorrin-2 dehydrogenase/sirohydrochlorin ferrochelatase